MATAVVQGRGNYFVVGLPVLAIVRVFNDSLDGRLQVVSEIPSEPLNGILKESRRWLEDTTLVQVVDSNGRESFGDT